MAQQTIYPFANIPGKSDLTAQFTRVKIIQTNSKNGKSIYKLVAKGEALGAKWLQTTPSRKAGRFSFDSITGKDAWKQLFGKDNPNSFLTSEGRSKSFETEYFRKNRNGNYVSRINPANPRKDDITGLWKNASLFIDSTTSSESYLGDVIANSVINPEQCNGNTLVAPVVITNYTNVTQTGSIRINQTLAAEVSVSYNIPTTAINCLGSDSPSAFNENFTLQPGQTVLYYLWMGGQGYGIGGGSPNIQISGGDLSWGTWYDFYLNLGKDDNFEKLTLNYSNTGGTGSNNNQFGFNATYATYTSTYGVDVYQNSTNIWSPYSKGGTNGNWYLPPDSPPSKWEPVIYWNNPPNEVNRIIGLAWIA